MIFSKKLFFMILTLITMTPVVKLSASQNTYNSITQVKDWVNDPSKNTGVSKIIESKSANFHCLLLASYFASKAGPYIIPLGINNYLLGRKLANQESMLTPQTIKNRGLFRVGLGMAMIVPFYAMGLAIDIEKNRRERGDL